MLEIVKSVRSEGFVSLSLLRQKIPEEFQPQFCQDTKICLDCGEVLVQKDDELSCVGCGRIWSDDVQVEQDTIPFSEDADHGHAEGHFNPGSTLAFGGGLGSVFDGRMLYKVLAEGVNGPGDVPLRAAQIRCITQKKDHPTVENLLSLGSKLMKDYDLRSNSDSNVCFANMLGRKLRKVAAYYVIAGRTGTEARNVARAVFYMLFIEKHPAEAERLRVELDLSSEWIRFTQVLLSVLEAPKKPKHQKKPKGQD